MKRLIHFLLFLLLSTQVFSQNTNIQIVYKESIFNLKAKVYHEIYYIPASSFFNQMSIPYTEKNGNIFAYFEKATLELSPGQPFILVTLNSDIPKIYQLPVSIFTDNNETYIPFKYGIDALSAALGYNIFLKDSVTLIIGDKNFETAPNFTDNEANTELSKTQISRILVYEKGGGVVIRLFTDQKVFSYKSFYKQGEFKLILNNSELESGSSTDLQTDMVSNVTSIVRENNLEITFLLDFDYYFSDVVEISGTTDLFARINVQPDPTDWFKTESDNFIVLYRESHSSLIPYIVKSAESSLKILMSLFDYVPSEKIVINMYDVSDYGFGATTTIPQNYIRVEIEPLEPGYENIPYNERLQWLISHELVHIVVNDQASSLENISRKIFQKVSPEQVQPITVFYSILTNYSRFTPRWHQEGIAVFLETWMSGGFGRILGNFDEMFFRTMVLDNQEFPSDIKLDAKTTHNSFLIETLFYLYGARFAAYLAIKYDAQKFIDWFKISSSDFYHGFKSKFEKVFHSDFDDEWSAFIEYEKEFQKKNIDKLKSYKTTEIRRLKNEPYGFTTQPQYDPFSNSIIFGYHKPHHLSSILKLNLLTNQTDEIGTLPTPSQYQVASSAFDYNTGLFFYTTNNNQLYRDVNVLDVQTEETKELFKDSRIGCLTVSPETHELWGIKHTSGKPAIIYSPYPYNILQQVLEFSVGFEVQQLSVNPDGKLLAATLLNSAGEQSIIIIETDSLLTADKVTFTTVTKSGSPENPSWSSNGKTLYWNAFTNGVSNIYKIVLGINSTPVALSHNLRGLFKPIEISNDSLFAFEFTSEGLIPVIIPDKPAGILPAINYLGQEVIKKNSVVYNWYVPPATETSSLKIKDTEEEYNSLAHLKIQTLVPVISGFQKQKMLGIFTHISDPLLNHDITIEMGYSPFNENPLGPKWHFRGKYEYKKQWQFGFEHNAPDFYDLFNERKRGLIGSKALIGHTYYWIYDNPLKVNQHSEIAYYFDQVFINDNLVRVSEADFGVAQTVFNSKNLRRTIGSSDFEYGNDFTITLRMFGTKLVNGFEYAGQIIGEWDHFTTIFFPHNVFHFQFAGGYHKTNEKIFQARFFFGGFGNRALENVDVKQFRKVFRFPGVPIYSVDAEQFGKIMIENNLPPLRFSNVAIGNHFLNHIDFSIYSQFLYLKSPVGEKWIDTGAQLNFIFKHWFNLESTLSGGIAKAWFQGGEDWEWFVSFKLLKN